MYSPIITNRKEILLTISQLSICVPDRYAATGDEHQISQALAMSHLCTARAIDETLTQIKNNPQHIYIIVHTAEGRNRRDELYLTIPTNPNVIVLTMGTNIPDATTACAFIAQLEMASNSGQ